METIRDGWNQLTGAASEKILRAIAELDSKKPRAHGAVYGDGHASEHIRTALETSFGG